MADLKITTVNNFDRRGLFPRRTIHCSGKAAETPTAATRCDKLQKQEEVHPASRGVCELYRTVGGDDLDEAMQRSDGGRVNEALRRQYRDVRDDEIAFTFLKYDEATTLGPGHAAFLTDLQATYSDVLIVPLMPKLSRNIGPDDDEEPLERPLSDTQYRSFKKGVVTFLNAAEDRHPEMPVMGLFPRVGWEYLNDLMSVYQSFDLSAYAFNFDRCKPTTDTQVAMIRWLMKSIAGQRIEDHVLFYAINPAPGTPNDDLGARPAADIASVGLGFDIIGGRHESYRASEEAFEEMELGREEFRLFDTDDWVYREVPYEDLVDEFPDRSSLNPDRITARLNAGGQNAKYRFQALVNTEQIGIAAADLRSALEAGDTAEQLRKKLGVTVQTQEAFQDVRRAFIQGREQSELGDFNN